jgi:hypothetical protein
MTPADHIVGLAFRLLGDLIWWFALNHWLD